MQYQRVEEPVKRNWLAFVVGLFLTVWGISHAISGKQGGMQWFIAWLVSMVIIILSGGVWLLGHIPLSVAAAWIGSK